MIKPSDESSPPFVFRRDGSGLALSWKSIGALITAVVIATGAYLSLKSDVSGHADQLFEVKTDLKTMAQAVAVDHDLLMRVDGKLDNVIQAQRREAAK